LNILTSFLQGKTKKSAGVRVTPAVHSAIAKANALRDRQEWLEAATHYREALQLDAKLSHVWVQLGHAFKEGGQPSPAADAYVRALRLNPQDPALLGWIYGVAGRLEPDQRRSLITELFALQGRSLSQELMPAPAQARPGDGEIVFDVSDLMAYFARARRPTGIQRVQIEIINAALDNSGYPVRICCSIEQSICWVEISKELFKKVTMLAVDSTPSTNKEWHDTLQDLNSVLIFSDPFEFGKKAKIINLGTSWWLQNYFLQIRNASIQDGIEYIPFIHDLIPFLAPEHCVQGLVDDFNNWILGVFDHAQRFLVNSHATKADLLRVAGALGKPIADKAVTVVPLDGAFAVAPPSEPSRTLRHHRLDTRPFALFVSTIESRKGHLDALRAWQTLLDLHGDATPYLVCVGNNGWLNQPFYEALEKDERLRERVILLSGLGDSELAYLYQTCLFTIYPSTFEGWGLPITEALTVGKNVIAANNSSLPEAGGEYAIYFETGNSQQLAHEASRLTFDNEFRLHMESNIKSHYSPRSWSDISEQILQAVGEQPDQSVSALVPLLPTATWFDLRRQSTVSSAPRPQSGERLRIGAGWEAPDRRGCAIRGERAELMARIAEGDAGHLLIRMRGEGHFVWSVMLNGTIANKGRCEGADSVWAICPIPNAATELRIVFEMRAIAGGAAGTRPELIVEGGIVLPLESSAPTSSHVMWALALNRFDIVQEMGSVCATPAPIQLAKRLATGDF
jgi:glycosyltransferase involved in cell wall biosynthesis